MIQRCTRCHGIKLIMGMGGLMHKCTVCKGTGFANRITAKEEDDFLNTETRHFVVEDDGVKPKSARPKFPNLTPLPMEKLPIEPAIEPIGG